VSSTAQNVTVAAAPARLPEIVVTVPEGCGEVAPDTGVLPATGSDDAQGY
jgi:hypothetical protein